MVRKLQKIARNQAAAPGLLDNELAGAVRDSAQQIWLAGMGAFAKAQAQGGKVFEKLVKEGVSLQRRTQAVAEERIGDVAGKMTAMADGVTNKAGQKWDRLESIFEQRVEKALRKLGVPSSRDTDALIRRIDALHAQVEALRKGLAPAAAQNKAATKPTTRRTRAAAADAPAPTARRAAAKQVASPPATKVAGKKLATKTTGRTTSRTPRGEALSTADGAQSG